MDAVLDLLGVIAFILGMLALSAGVTYAVVRVDNTIRIRRARG